MAVLRGMYGELKGRLFPLSDGETTVGRHPDNNIVLDEGSISAFHCTLVREGAKYSLHDLGSTNGTRVNGRPVSTCRVASGDIVQIGAIEMIVEGKEIEGRATPSGIPSKSRGEGLVADNRIGAPAAAAAGRGNDFRPSSGRKGIGLRIVIGVVGVLALAGVVALFVFLSRTR